MKWKVNNIYTIFDKFSIISPLIYGYVMRFYVLIFCFLLNVPFSFSQNSRKVAVLDMTAYTAGNSPSRRLSAIGIIRTIGVPYIVTTDLSEAVQHPIIITGSRIEELSFNASERSQLIAYVQNGGVLITSNLRDTNLFALCGITSRATSNTLYEINFNTNSASVFDLIDDPLETTVSIGNPANGFSFYTQFYDLGTGISLANYEDNSVALVKNSTGQGTVYLFGPDFRDITYRNQLDLDVQAQRSYSNGFEPTTDVFFIIIRNIIRQHLPHTVFKYTIPYNYSSAVMITHDVDSQTAIDTMSIFSNFEESAGISALYNITTRYFHDGLMSNFYVGSGAQIEEVKNEGHILASHSVGHFPDFDDETLFPLGNLGNTANNYNPYYTSGNTSGGSVLGEVEVSKNLLENDHNVEIRSFRPGHLAFNDSLTLGLEMTNYEFSSNRSANNVLTSFPYYAMKVRTFDGIESSVLEIPMTISDVYNGLDATNYSNLVTIWVNVTYKYAANHSPVVLLIHPNRTYKLTAEMDYLNQLPPNTLVYPFEKYGEFWRKRDSLAFHTELANDSLVVQFDNNLLTEMQSLVIDFAGLTSVQFIDQNNDLVYFDWIPWDNGSRLYFQEETMRVAAHREKKEQLSIYPNPTHEQITVDFQQYREKVILSLYDLSGRRIYSVETSGRSKTISLSRLQIEPGMYLLVVKFPGKTLRGKVIFQK